MKIFDSHAHYDDEAFDKDRYELIEKLKSENVACITNIGSSMETSRSSIALAKKYNANKVSKVVTEVLILLANV